MKEKREKDGNNGVLKKDKKKSLNKNMGREKEIDITRKRHKELRNFQHLIEKDRFTTCFKTCRTNSCFFQKEFKNVILKVKIWKLI